VDIRRPILRRSRSALFTPNSLGHGCWHFHGSCSHPHPPPATSKPRFSISPLRSSTDPLPILLVRLLPRLFSRYKLSSPSASVILPSAPIQSTPITSDPEWPTFVLCFCMYPLIVLLISHFLQRAWGTFQDHPNDTPPFASYNNRQSISRVSAEQQTPWVNGTGTFSHSVPIRPSTAHDTTRKKFQGKLKKQRPSTRDGYEGAAATGTFGDSDYKRTRFPSGEGMPVAPPNPPFTRGRTASDSQTRRQDHGFSHPAGSSSRGEPMHHFPSPKMLIKTSLPSTTLLPLGATAVDPPAAPSNNSVKKGKLFRWGYKRSTSHPELAPQPPSGPSIAPQLDLPPLPAFYVPIPPPPNVASEDLPSFDIQKRSPKSHPPSYSSMPLARDVALPSSLVPGRRMGAAVNNNLADDTVMRAFTSTFDQPSQPSRPVISATTGQPSPPPKDARSLPRTVLADADSTSLYYAKSLNSDTMSMNGAPPPLPPPYASFERSAPMAEKSQALASFPPNSKPYSDFKEHPPLSRTPHQRDGTETVSGSQDSAVPTVSTSPNSDNGPVDRPSTANRQAAASPTQTPITPPTQTPSPAPKASAAAGQSRSRPTTPKNSPESPPSKSPPIPIPPRNPNRMVSASAPAVKSRFVPNEDAAGQVANYPSRAPPIRDYALPPASPPPTAPLPARPVGQVVSVSGRPVSSSGVRMPMGRPSLVPQALPGSRTTVLRPGVISRPPSASGPRPRTADADVQDNNLRNSSQAPPAPRRPATQEQAAGKFQTVSATPIVSTVAFPRPPSRTGPPPVFGNPDTKPKTVFGWKSNRRRSTSEFSDIERLNDMSDEVDEALHAPILRGISETLMRSSQVAASPTIGGDAPKEETEQNTEQKVEPLRIPPQLVVPTDEEMTPKESVQKPHIIAMNVIPPTPVDTLNSPNSPDGGDASFLDFGREDGSPPVSPVTPGLNRDSKQVFAST
jgi:hypothetical protein